MPKPSPQKWPLASKNILSNDHEKNYFIIIDCQATLQGKPYPSFKDNVKGTLSKLGVNFVNNKEQADWVITINADVVRENTVHGSYFVWVDGDVSVLKKATNQVVYSNTISELEEGHSDGIKGGHTSGSSQAAKAAYKEAAQILAIKLSEVIKQ